MDCPVVEEPEVVGLKSLAYGGAQERLDTLETSCFRSALGTPSADASKRYHDSSLDYPEGSLLTTVYHTETDLVISLYPTSLTVFRGHPWNVARTSSFPPGENDTSSSNEDNCEELPSQPLCHWRAEDSKERDLLTRVGSFTRCTVAERGHFIFLGTEKGCLVVFALDVAQEPDVSQSDSSVSSGFLSHQSVAVTLRPFLWSDVGALADHDEGEDFGAGHKAVSVLDLTACCVFSDPSDNKSFTFVVTVLLDHGVLAVLEANTTTGVTPVDVLHLPAAVTKLSCLPAVTHSVDYWSVSIAVAGIDTLLLLQVTQNSVTLAFSASIQELRKAFSSVACVPSDPFLHNKAPDSASELLDISFSSDYSQASEVHLVYCTKGPAKYDLLELVTVNTLTHGVSIERTGVDGSVAALKFVIGAAIFALPFSGYTSYGLTSWHVSGLCVITQYSMQLLAVPSLAVVHCSSLDNILHCLPPSAEMAEQDLQAKTPFVDSTKTCQEAEARSSETLELVSRFHQSMLKSITVCSSIGRCVVKNRFGLETTTMTEKRVALELTTPLALTLVSSTNAASSTAPVRTTGVMGFWLTRKSQLFCGRDPTGDPLTLLQTQHSEDFHEQASRIKQQIEVMIERAKQDSALHTIDPAALLNLLNTLITVSSRTGKEEGPQHILPYVANVARMAPFKTFDATKSLLSGVVDLLISAESLSPDRNAPRVSSSVSTALQKLTTFAMLARLKEKEKATTDERSAHSENINVSGSTDTRGHQDTSVCFDINLDRLNSLFLDTETDDELDWPSWSRFLKADVTKLCCHFASAGALTEFFIVFNRHVADFDRDTGLRSEKIMKVLHCFPAKLPSRHMEHSLGEWLRQQVLPFLTDSTSFVAWLTSRALALEAVWRDPLPALGFLSAVFPDCLLSKMVQHYASTELSEDAQLHAAVENDFRLNSSVNENSETPTASLLSHGGTAPLPTAALPMLPGAFVTLSAFWSGCGSVLGNLSGTLFLTSPHKRSPGKNEQIKRLTQTYCLLLECAHINRRHELRVRFSDLDSGQVCWSDIAYALLNRVRLPELLTDEVRVHVKPFCEAHGVHTEELLMSYIYDIVGEIDTELLSTGDTTAAASVREREIRAVALVQCLHSEHSKAKCLLLLLHAWSPLLPPATPEALGLVPLLTQLQTSKCLTSSPILKQLQSAIALRELQGLLGKYNMRAHPSVFTKPTEARLLVAHLACLISWKATSFTNALTVVRLLRPFVESGIDEVSAAMLRLQSMTSTVNRKLFTQIIHGLRTGLIGSARQTTGAVKEWMWKGYDAWEATWRPVFFREVEETVISHLTSGQLNEFTDQYTSYAFNILENAATTLQTSTAKNAQSSVASSSTDDIFVAAETIIVTLTAVFLQQHVTTSSELNSSIYSPAASVTGSRWAWVPKGGQQSRTRHSLLGGQFNGYDENRARKRETPHLEILQRCERLRREFGVFVKPSDLSSTRLVADDQNTIMSTRRERRSGIGFCSRRVLARSLSSRWRSTVEAHALGNTRALFNALAKKRIDDVTQIISAPSVSFLPHRTTNLMLGPNVTNEAGPSTAKEGSQFTQLLQFGVLMGVGESYVRHQCIVRPQVSPTAHFDLVPLTRLITDLERNPSARNASDILQMLQRLVLNLYGLSSDPRMDVSIFVSLSHILDIAAHCLRALPEEQLESGLHLACDILLVLQLLVQSDLLDAALEFTQEMSSGPSVQTEPGQQNHSTSSLRFSSYSKIFFPCFMEPSDAIGVSSPSLFREDIEDQAKASLSTRALRTEPSCYNRKTSLSSLNTKLFSNRFRGVSALYGKRQAIRDVMELLMFRHGQEHLQQQNGLADNGSVGSQHFNNTTADSVENPTQRLQSVATTIVKTLLDLESYELALAFLFRFSDDGKTGSRLKETAAHLLTKVISARNSFDYELGTGLSLLLGRSEVWRRFLDAIPGIRDVSRMLFYSRLVVDVGFLLLTPYLVKNAAQIWIRAKWRERLDALGCQYDAKRFQEVQEKRPGEISNVCQKELLPHLLATSSFSLPLATQFARDFEIPEVDLLSYWLKLVLVHLPMLEYNGTQQCLSSFSVQLTRNTEQQNGYSTQHASQLQQSYRHLMFPVLYSLTSDKIEEILERECLPHISPYDYDCLELLLSWIPHRPIARAGLVVLHYIYSHVRSYPPTADELNNWGKPRLRPMSPLESKLQAQRLPFHALMEEPWTVLGPAVSDATLDTLMPLYPLRLRRDDFQLQLLWNFIEDVRETEGNTLGLRGSRWILPGVQQRRTGCGRSSDRESFSVCETTEEFSSVQLKLTQLLEACYTVHPERAVAAALLILEQQALLPIGHLQVAVAEWAASKITSPEQKKTPKEAFSAEYSQALPPYQPPGLQAVLHRLGYCAPDTRSGRHAPFLLQRTVEEASREAGMLRSRWALLECDLSDFVPLLPGCALLCVFALYYYLAPVLLRPTPIGLLNEVQRRVFLTLSRYPFLQLPSASGVETNGLWLQRQLLMTPETSAAQKDADDASTLPSSSTCTALHSLVNTICLGCNLNPKVARALLLRRLLKAPFWTPLHVVNLLERNMAMYKEQDIVAMVGSVPTLESFALAKSTLVAIEQSVLTEGFRDAWFSPFHSMEKHLNGRQLTTRERHLGFTFGQSQIELIAKQRQYLIVSGMESRVFVKLALEIALKNERALATSSRTLSLLYTAESTEMIHTLYKESPENTLEFWKHSLYLDAFDYLGIASQFGNFMKADKGGLIRAFWRQSRGAADAGGVGQSTYLLILIVALYLDFQVQDSRFLARVLTKLLTIMRSDTLDTYAALKDGTPGVGAAALQTPQSLNSLRNDTNGFSTAEYLRALLSALFLRHHQDPDPELLVALDALLQAPVVHLIDFFDRLERETIPSTSLSCCLRDNASFFTSLLPTLHWLLWVPSFLHRSALAHLHHAVSVGIKFFELAHRLLVGYASQRNAAAVRRRSNERPELASQRLSATAFWAPCGTAEHPAATHEALKVCSGVLDQLDALWSSCSLTTRIFESWNVQWILRNGKNESGSQQQLLTLKKLRLQVLCIALGIQCFDNSTSNSKHILTLVTQDFCYCLPPFLLMLFGATRCRIPLVATFANVIIKQESLSQEAAHILHVAPASTRRAYFDALSTAAEHNRVPLHDALMVFRQNSVPPNT